MQGESNESVTPTGKETSVNYMNQRLDQITKDLFESTPGVDSDPPAL